MKVTSHTLDAGGALTLPPEWRRQHGVPAGGTVTLIDLGDGSLLLVPVRPQLDRLAAEITRAMQDAGFTAESILAALDEERTRSLEENREDEA